MVKKILLATDGSDNAVGAAVFLARLPLQPGTAIQVVCVVDRLVENVLEAVQPGQRGRALRLVEAAADGVRRAGIEVTTVVRTGDADHQIILAAQEFGADLLVLGSQGLTGLEDFLLGSVARNVAKHASCTVLVVRASERGIDSVIVAADGSAHARHAVAFAAELPLPADTQFTLVYSVRPQHPIVDLTAIGDERLYAALQDADQQRRQNGAELLRDATACMETYGRRSTAELREGDPAEQILAVAEERSAGLIVAGARGVSLIEKLVMGSVADRLLKRAPCSVLIVR
jgi:nucleotide-binding universal stress UspA family protein